MRVMIETTIVYPANFESRKAIDWNNSSDRKWLMNHLMWAMNNGRRVTIEPTESN